MTDDFAVIIDDGRQPALSLGHSIAAVVIDVDVRAVLTKGLQIGDQLVGEHGVALRDQEIGFGAFRGEFVAAQNDSVAALEFQRLQGPYIGEAPRIGYTCHGVPQPKHQGLAKSAADRCFDVEFFSILTHGGCPRAEQTTQSESRDEEVPHGPSLGVVLDRDARHAVRDAGDDFVVDRAELRRQLIGADFLVVLTADDDGFVAQFHVAAERRYVDQA